MPGWAALGLIQVSENLTWGDLGAMAAVFTMVAVVLGLAGTTYFRRTFADRETVDRLNTRLDAYVGATPESTKVIMDGFLAAIREVGAMGERHAAERYAQLRQDVNSVAANHRDLTKEVSDLTEGTIEIRSVMRMMYPDAARRVLGENFEQRAGGSGRGTGGG